jgi:hypothetical protein
LIAVENQIPNVMFFVPRPYKNNHTPVLATKEIRSWYNIGKYDLDLVLFNYHILQIRPKEIKRVINSLTYLPGKEINLMSKSTLLNDYIDTWNHWRLKRLLNTKAFSKYLAVSGNRDILLYLAYQADRFKDIEDDEEYNFRHSHADTIGTSVDNGMDFYYYYENSLK